MAFDDFPPLWIRYRDIEVVDTTGHPNRTQHIEWLPPECPGGFVTVRIRPWQILTLGSEGNRHSLVSVDRGLGDGLYNLPDNVSLHDTASIFFTTELNGFFEVPYDCTTTHVAERRARDDGDGWRPITFFKLHPEAAPSQNSRLWCIAHAHVKQMDRGVTITDSWNELLLPGSFYNGIQKDASLQTCELAGRFTLIFGLLAFTTTPRNSYDGRIRESFRYPGTSHYVPTWQTGHPPNQGLIQRRGLVVDIAFDRDQCRPGLLKEWEAGEHGPILTSNPDWEQSYV